MGKLKKKLYGVGTGPGHKDYLTIKSVKAIEEADIIFSPNNKGKNMALDTAKDFIKNKKILLIDFPMGRVEDRDYIKASKTIYENIKEGETGVFLTIGDPLIYSTFIYIIEKLDNNYKDLDIEIVPGIPSFVAAAAKTKLPLTIKDDNFILCDSIENLTEYDLKSINSLAILKTYKNKEKTLDILENENFDYKYIKRVSFEEEEILESRKDILSDKDYISLILARKKD